MAEEENIFQASHTGFPVSWKRDRYFQIGKFLSPGISSFLELVSLASFGP
jgi:hypothetical protein